MAAKVAQRAASFFEGGEGWERLKSPSKGSEFCMPVPGRTMLQSATAIAIITLWLCAIDGDEESDPHACLHTPRVEI